MTVIRHILTRNCQSRYRHKWRVLLFPFGGDLFNRLLFKTATQLNLDVKLIIMLAYFIDNQRANCFLACIYIKLTTGDFFSRSFSWRDSYLCHIIAMTHYALRMKIIKQGVFWLNGYKSAQCFKGFKRLFGR